jgi:hypothetical protein
MCFIARLPPKPSFIGLALEKIGGNAFGKFYRIAGMGGMRRMVRREEWRKNRGEERGWRERVKKSDRREGEERGVKWSKEKIWKEERLEMRNRQS